MQLISCRFTHLLFTGSTGVIRKKRTRIRKSSSFDDLSVDDPQKLELQFPQTE